MTDSKRQYLVWVALISGGIIWGGFAKRLDGEGRLSYEPNVACMKGSPYGKVLALAMQGPIDVYFHKGVSHATSEALREDKFSVDEDRGHEGGSVDGREHEHEHAEGCGCGAHDHQDEEVEIAVSSAPLHQRLKKRLLKMAAYANRNTDGQPMTPAHEHYLKSVNEDKLKLAYELDPSNYTNYGNYHLFLSMNDFGKSQRDEEAALSLAYRTLEFCKRDEVDPATWLTAANAAYSVIFHIGANYKKYSEFEARESLFEFDFCMENYEKLLDESVKKGSIVSTERLLEMKTRAKFLIKLRQAQGVYMKRIMSNESDGIPSKKE